MRRRRKKQPVSREETAALIEQIAERIANGDRSFDLQLPMTTAQQRLVELRDVEGSLLLNRISLLLLTENGTANVRYDYVRERVKELAPLDPDTDVAALRALAEKIRGGA
jgi:hypothetical protein